MSTSSPDRRLRMMERFRNREYRHAYVDASIKNALASQIHEMRLSRGWTQEDLARRTSKKQGVISRLEDPDYGRYSLKTLQELAAAFDVALVVRFAPFSELTNWISGLSAEDLAVAPYEHDLAALQSGISLRLAGWGSRFDHVDVKAIDQEQGVVGSSRNVISRGIVSQISDEPAWHLSSSGVH